MPHDQPRHHPLRLLLPGWEGNANVKWLRRLKVMDHPAMTREETSKYTDLLADGRARRFTYVMDRWVLPWIYWNLILKGRA